MPFRCGWERSRSQAAWLSIPLVGLTSLIHPCPVWQTQQAPCTLMSPGFQPQNMGGESARASAGASLTMKGCLRYKLCPSLAQTLLRRWFWGRLWGPSQLQGCASQCSPAPLPHWATASTEMLWFVTMTEGPLMTFPGPARCEAWWHPKSAGLNQHLLSEALNLHTPWEG